MPILPLFFHSMLLFVSLKQLFISYLPLHALDILRHFLRMPFLILVCHLLKRFFLLRRKRPPPFSHDDTLFRESHAGEFGNHFGTLSVGEKNVRGASSLGTVVAVIFLFFWRTMNRCCSFWRHLFHHCPSRPCHRRSHSSPSWPRHHCHSLPSESRLPTFYPKPFRESALENANTTLPHRCRTYHPLLFPCCSPYAVSPSVFPMYTHPLSCSAETPSTEAGTFP
mmetsp:Transcript_9180/g.19825  ORF Transcript_9180/g.19825 Transcript_9180/m.19825 type:complete len:224 (-) Transcript_9180:537-1208(-)